MKINKQKNKKQKSINISKKRTTNKINQQINKTKYKSININKMIKNK